MDPFRRRLLQLFPGGCLALASQASLAAPQVQDTHDQHVPPCRPETDADWRQVRRCFPMADDLAYLNAGGLGPAPHSVLEAVCKTIYSLQRHTKHGHALLDEARSVVANSLGAAPAELAFTRNATEANSTIASGLALRPGDEVIIDAHAHPGGAISWMTRQKFDGICVRTFEPDPKSAEVNVRRIEELIGPRTRVIQVSHVTAPTGIKLPVEAIAELAKAKDIWFHIDGAQSWGMFPVDVTALQCDSYASSGHKWMCGPIGTGVLYVKHDRLQEVRPTDVGAYAASQWQLPAELNLVDTACRFECGTRDASTIVGLSAAVKFIDRIGLQTIHQRGLQLARTLRQSLQALRSVALLSPTCDGVLTPMTSFRVPGRSCDEVFRFLMEHRLRCRPVRERNLDAIRVSTHFFNSQDELEQLVEALRKL